MPIYREAGEPLLYEVIKVQTCSGQPLEVTTSSGNYTYIQPATTATDITKDELFKYQLERDSFTGTPTVLALIASTQSAGADVLAVLNWEEVVY